MTRLSVGWQRSLGSIPSKTKSSCSSPKGPVLDPPSLQFDWFWGYLAGGRGDGVWIWLLSCIVLGLGMSGVAPLLLPCAFVAWVGTALPLLACFTLSLIGDKRRGLVLALLYILLCVGKPGKWCCIYWLASMCYFTTVQRCNSNLFVRFHAWCSWYVSLLLEVDVFFHFSFLTCLLRSWSNLWGSILGSGLYFFSLFYMLVCIICWSSTLISITWSNDPVLLLPTQCSACSCVS